MAIKSRLSEKAQEKLSLLEEIFNGSILVYTYNSKKKLEQKNRIRKADSLWNEQFDDENQFKKPKEESSVVIAQIVKLADDAPEKFKKLLGRTVWINGLVGKTYWLSSDEIEELTWIDSSAIYGLAFEE